MLNEALGQVPLLGHLPRRLRDLLPDALHRAGRACRAATTSSARRPSSRTSAHTLNAFISVAALIVGFAQMVFLFNLVWSLRHGRAAGGNPWRATTLEWQTPETPPGHGNWGKELPVVYRWAYDYSVPGAPRGLHPAERAPGAAAGLEPRHERHHPVFARRSIAAWWLSHQRLMSKPWLEEGRRRRAGAPAASAMPTAKIGLGVFLAVVGSLFALFISAYFMRMELADWRPMPMPTLLWLNTGVLICRAASRCNGRRVAARAGRWRRAARPAHRRRTALAFLAGQLSPGGSSRRRLLPAGNPANSFFYLITAAARAAHARRPGGAGPDGAPPGGGGRHPTGCALSLELCAMYWHFLLLVWLGLFACCCWLGHRLRRICALLTLRHSTEGGRSGHASARPAARRRLARRRRRLVLRTSAPSRTCPGGRP